MKEIKLTARPWQPQDLLDDLQQMIDEQPDNYLKTDRQTLCTAKAYLEEHFAEPKWIPVTERLPDEYVSVLVCIPTEHPLPTVKEAYLANGCWSTKMWIFDKREVTHWMPLPEPPKKAE